MKSDILYISLTMGGIFRFMSDDCAVKYTETLVKQFSIDQKTVTSIEPFEALRAVLVNKPRLQLSQNSLHLCGISFNLHNLKPSLLKTLLKILNLQNKRHDLFREHINVESVTHVCFYTCLGMPNSEHVDRCFRGFSPTTRVFIGSIANDSPR